MNPHIKNIDFIYERKSKLGKLFKNYKINIKEKYKHQIALANEKLALGQSLLSITNFLNSELFSFNL